MRVYLVDLENCGDVFKNIEDADYKSSRCIIVYSNRCEVVYNKYLPIAQKYFKYVDSLRVEGIVKNALDFNLSMYLGYMLGKFRGKRVEVIIISKDKGYSALKYAIESISNRKNIGVSFLEKSCIRSDYRRSSLNELYYIRNLTILQLIISNQHSDKWHDLVMLSCPYLQENDYDLINSESMSYVNSWCKKLSRNIKSGLHSYLVKQKGQEMGTKIYYSLKRTHIYDLYQWQFNESSNMASHM